VGLVGICFMEGVCSSGSSRVVAAAARCVGILSTTARGLRMLKVGIGVLALVEDGWWRLPFIRCRALYIYTHKYNVSVLFEPPQIILTGTTPKLDRR
jgi:hypothetical protein